MRFFEGHFINRVYVSSPFDVNSAGIRATSGVAWLNHGKSRTLGAWPRREIADPMKLLEVVNDQSPWSVFIHASQDDTSPTPFFTKKQAWYQQLQTLWPKTTEGEFYILCERPELFNSMKDLLNDPNANLEDWLELWWQTPFLITTSVYTCEDLPNCLYGIVNGAHPPLRCELEIGNCLDGLLQGRCYTIGNGLTLALAMHRAKAMKLRSKLFAHNLFKFMERHDFRHLYQDVTSSWMGLYYGHLSQQIADFPYYYVCMGPKFADQKVIFMLLPGESESFPHVLKGNNVALTSYKTSMLPYIHTSVWHSLGDTYVGIPDIRGMLTAIICNRNTWRWWTNEEWKRCLSKWISYGYLRETLQYSFDLYKNGSDNGHVCHNRCVQLWYQASILDSAHFKKLVPLLLPNSPFQFGKLCSEVCDKGIITQLRSCNHIYYCKGLNNRITIKLLALYKCFGLGTHACTFSRSSIVGELVMNYIKEHRSVLYT